MDRDAQVLRLIPHVQRDDHRFSFFQKFNRQEKAAFEAGGSNDIHNHIGPVQQRYGYFFRFIARLERIGSRRIDDFQNLPVPVHPPF
jgi:hypothetical protein